MNDLDLKMFDEVQIDLAAGTVREPFPAGTSPVVITGLCNLGTVINDHGGKESEESHIAFQFTNKEGDSIWTRSYQKTMNKKSKLLEFLLSVFALPSLDALVEKGIIEKKEAEVTEKVDGENPTKTKTVIYRPIMSKIIGHYCSISVIHKEETKNGNKNIYDSIQSCSGWMNGMENFPIKQEWLTKVDIDSPKFNPETDLPKINSLLAHIFKNKSKSFIAKYGENYSSQKNAETEPSTNKSDAALVDAM